MQKAFLIFLGLLALGNAQSVTTAVPGDSTPVGTVTTAVPEDSTTEDSTETTTDAGCLYDSQTWGDPNLQQFKFCLNDVPKTTTCNENYYYVSNDTVSGCVPSDEMNVKCRNLDVTVDVCTGYNLKQPQLSETITDYWFCDGLNKEPIEFTCLRGAFIKQGFYLGCFEWPEWRQLRGCETYQ